MKPKRTRRLLILTMMSSVILLLSLPVTAADPCGRENQVSCISQALTTLQSCCNTYGNQGCTTFCVTQFDEEYTGCMVLKGCATPPPPQL